MTIDSALRLRPIAHLEQTIQFNDDEQVKKIRDVKNRGLLVPYEADLSKNENWWERETWLDRIQQMANGGTSEKSISENYHLPLFLFAVAIDPDVAAEEKQSILATTQQSLEKEQLERLHHGLINILPPVISTNILRHYTKDIWKELYIYLQHYCSRTGFSRNNGYGKFFTRWIEEAVKNQWSKEEKQIFLDDIVDVTSTSNGNDVLYYFLLHSSEDIQKQFSEICSPALVERIEHLKNEVIQYGHTLLSDIAEKSEIVRIPFYNSQRQYFLEWFYKNALDRENVSLIAAGLHERDWNWLQNRSNKENQTRNKMHDCFSSYNCFPSPLISFAMESMIDIADRLKLGTLQGFPSISFDIRLWDFFKHASSILEKEHEWRHIPHKSYENFSKALTAENLFHYFEAFQGNLKNIVIRRVMYEHPQNLISWFQIILQMPEDNFDQDEEDILVERSLGKILKLFSVIAKDGCLQEAIRIIFDVKQNDNILMLSTFCAATNEQGIEILKHILSNRADGIKTLTQWVKMCLQEGHLKPYVRDAFLLDIYLLLQEIDPTIAKTLKAILDRDSDVQSSPRNQEFVNLTFPVGIDLNDPTARQELAIRKLRHHFLTPGVPYRDRCTFVYHLRGDLKILEGPSVYLPKLFDQFPQETWPLIFLHFEVCPSTYHNYWEEKHPEVIPKKTEDRLPIPPKWLPNLEHWIDIAAQTLTQMVDNPCFTHNGHHLNVPAKMSMKELINAIWKTNSTRRVIQKFIEITPPALFIPAINQLVNSHRLNTSILEKIIAKALDNANVDKTGFVATCIFAQHQRHKSDAPSGSTSGTFALEEELWEKLYLKSHEERSAVSKILIHHMGIEFLGYFYPSSIPTIDFTNRRTTNIIESLKITDQAYTEQIFHRWTNQIIIATNSVDIKFQIFQNICHSYACAGVDVLELLKSESFKELLPTIQEWYCSEDLIDKHLYITTTLGLSLLRFFNEQGFYPAVFRQIKEYFTSPFVSFIGLNKLFEALESLECKDNVIHQLFGEQQEILEVMRTGFQEHLAKCFSSTGSSQSFPLACQLIPDWNERLITWTKDKIQKEKEQSMQRRCKPDYHEVVNFFKDLEEENRLHDFITALKSNASEEFVRDLNEAIEKFTKRKEGACTLL